MRKLIILILLLASIGFSKLCYQENATLAVTCGDLTTSASGAYASDGAGSASEILKIYDKSWSTYGNLAVPGRLYINYTKPDWANATFSMWTLMRSDNSSNNISMNIPTACWSAHATLLQFAVDYASNNATAGTGWFCYDGANWVLAQSAASDRKYEEGMLWSDGNQTNYWYTAPANLSSYTTWPTTFTMALDSGGYGLVGNLIEVDGVNNTCTLPGLTAAHPFTTANTTCSYTPTYLIYNKTYILTGYGNISYSGAYQQVNETRTFDYNGCGYLNSNVNIDQGGNATASTNCYFVNASNLIIDGKGRYYVGTAGNFMTYNGTTNNISVKNFNTSGWPGQAFNTYDNYNIDNISIISTGSDSVQYNTNLILSNSYIKSARCIRGGTNLSIFNSTFFATTSYVVYQPTGNIIIDNSSFNSSATYNPIQTSTLSSTSWLNISNSVFYIGANYVALDVHIGNYSFVNNHIIYNGTGPTVYYKSDVGDAYTISIINDIVDGNPSYTNYSNISLYSSGTGTFNISYVGTEGTNLPAGYHDFNNFLNFSGTATFTNMSMSWTEAQLTGYNETNLKLLRYNVSGWTVINSTPDTTNNRLSTFNFISPTGHYGIAEAIPIATYNTTDVTDGSSDVTVKWKCNDNGLGYASMLANVTVNDVIHASIESTNNSLTSHLITGLQVGEIYNVSVTCWNLSVSQASTGSFFTYNSTWYNASFPYRVPCYVNTTSATSLTNFPAHCIVDTATLIAAGKMNSSCKDIRVANATGVRLDYELENGTCNSATSVYWIRIPYTTAGGNDTIYAYYGNTTISSTENASGVWKPANYVSVWHFANESFDSLNINNLGASGSPSYTSSPTYCEYGYCINVTATSYMKNDSATHPTTTARTVSMWGSQGQNIGTGGYHVYDMGTMSTGNAEVFYARYANSFYYGQYAATEVGTTNITNSQFTGQKHFMAYAVYSSTSIAGFVNTTKTSKTTTGTDITSGKIYIGGSGDEWGELGWATLDEVRLSNASRSDDWLAAEYMQTDYIGPEENQPSGGSSLTSMVGGSLNWTWQAVTAGNIIRTGTPYNWSWHVYASGSGNKSVNGSSTNWSWVNE